MQCSEFDVGTAEDWRRCGRIRAYISIAVVIVIVLILVYAFSGTGRLGWGVAAIGTLIVLGMVFLLPDYMGDSKASEHAGLWKQVDIRREAGATKEHAIQYVKQQQQIQRLQEQASRPSQITINNGQGSSGTAGELANFASNFRWMLK